MLGIGLQWIGRNKFKLGGGEDDVVIGGTQQVFKNVQIYVRTQHR